MILSNNLFLQPVGPVLLTPNRTDTKIQQNHQRDCEPLAALPGSPGSGDETGQAPLLPRPSSGAEKHKAKRAAARLGNNMGNQGRGQGKMQPEVSARTPGAGRAVHPPVPRPTSSPLLGVPLPSEGARGTLRRLHCRPTPLWGQGGGLPPLPRPFLGLGVHSLAWTRYPLPWQRPQSWRPLTKLWGRKHPSAACVLLALPSPLQETWEWTMKAQAIP